ncbi:HNH endonuclease [Flavobacterium microcysteis]|uniref:HNH endonuclease n=1 Tax=Flavobacterium microcysteis TaxID=2596891 RepID=A0A501QCT9_9FLAO|nr:HNH endonuclease [Flavobacterium microcysteis]TPD69911.1 HNH endonuclease [Flavobacterium microcysteis]
METKIVYVIDPEEFYETYEISNSMLDYVSPKDEFHICRYCSSPNAKFKSKAHLLPEFTGNKTLFCYNECDDCNKKFGLYETNLSAFSGIKNTFLPIKGKNKYPKFKSKSGDFSVQFQNDNKVIAKVDGNLECMKLENGILNIKATTQTFIPLYVYKALTKFALSMVEKSELHKFRKTVEWINEPEKKFDDNFIPLLLIHNESRPPIIKPIAFLAKRKIPCDSPQYTFIFGFGFHRLQIFLPFNSSDEQLKSEKIILPLNFHFVTQKVKNKGEWGFGHMDMNSLNRSQLTDDFKLNFKLENEIRS